MTCSASKTQRDRGPGNIALAVAARVEVIFEVGYYANERRNKPAVSSWVAFARALMNELRIKLKYGKSRAREVSRNITGGRAFRIAND